MTIEVYQPRHFDGIERLWQECFPADPPRNRAGDAVPAKLALADGLLFVALDAQDTVIGSVMAGYDGHRGWLYAVAVTGSARRRGVGQALARRACSALAERGCAKVNLQVREGNDAAVAFYARLGFSVEPRVSLGLELRGYQ